MDKSMPTMLIRKSQIEALPEPLVTLHEYEHVLNLYDELRACYEDLERLYNFISDEVDLDSAFSTGDDERESQYGIEFDSEKGLSLDLPKLPTGIKHAHVNYNRKTKRFVAGVKFK